MRISVQKECYGVHLLRELQLWLVETRLGFPASTQPTVIGDRTRNPSASANAIAELIMLCVISTTWYSDCMSLLNWLHAAVGFRCTSFSMAAATPSCLVLPPLIADGARILKNFSSYWLSVFLKSVRLHLACDHLHYQVVGLNWITGFLCWHSPDF